MKFTSLSAVLALFASVIVNGVSGNYVVLQVLLNNGNNFYCIDQWDNCCTSTEWTLISDRVYSTFSQ
jgi:hypothetical protein